MPSRGSRVGERFSGGGHAILFVETRVPGSVHSRTRWPRPPCLGRHAAPPRGCGGSSQRGRMLAAMAGAVGRAGHGGNCRRRCHRSARACRARRSTSTSRTRRSASSPPTTRASVLHARLRSTGRSCDAAPDGPRRRDRARRHGPGTWRRSRASPAFARTFLIGVLAGGPAGRSSAAPRSTRASPTSSRRSTAARGPGARASDLLLHAFRACVGAIHELVDRPRAAPRRRDAAGPARRARRGRAGAAASRRAIEPLRAPGRGTLWRRPPS